MSVEGSSDYSPSQTEPTYLSDYFAARGYKKPPITWYIIENGSLNDLRQIVINRLFAGSAIRMDYVLAYLCGVADTQLKNRLEEYWISFGVVIGEKDEEISVRNLFEIEKEAKVQVSTETNDTKFGENDDDWIICSIFTIWRLNRYRKRPKKFEKTIEQAKYKNLRGDQIKLKALSMACKSWGNHPELSKIVAGYDMFLNYLRCRHSFDFVRFGSGISRDRDLDILLSINSICISLGMENFKLFYDWIFVKSLAREAQRILQPGEEINKFTSYLHYLKDLCQIPISPYCRAVNPGLYFFLHSIETLLISPRFADSPMYEKYFDINILANVCCVYYIHSTVNSFRLMCTPEPNEDLFKSFPDESITNFETKDDPPQSRDGKKFFLWLKHKQFILPERIINQASKRAKNQLETRKGSFGSFFQSFDFDKLISWKLESIIESNAA